MACVRTAWLDLHGDGATTIALEDEAGGYFCSSLDLGYPEVREVVTDRADQHGVFDRTKLFGSRVITANLTAIEGAGAQIDAVGARFAPFMDPAARPVLHYVLDRPSAPERVMTVRAAGYSWPIAGPFTRDIQLQWVAANPVVLDPVTQSATAAAEALAEEIATRNDVVLTSGELNVIPWLRVYGPITGPRVLLYGFTNSDLHFDAGLILQAGQYVDIDCANKLMFRNGDPAQSVAQFFGWGATWPVLAPGYAASLYLQGSAWSAPAHVEATWQDAYLI